MHGTVLAIAAAMFLAGCTPSRHQSFAQCQREDARATGTDVEDRDFLSTCMEARGYEIRDGECSVTAHPEKQEACYRLRAR